MDAHPSRAVYLTGDWNALAHVGASLYTICPVSIVFLHFAQGTTPGRCCYGRSTPSTRSRPFPPQPPRPPPPPRSPAPWRGFGPFPWALQPPSRACPSGGPTPWRCASTARATALWASGTVGSLPPGGWTPHAARTAPCGRIGRRRAWRKRGVMLPTWLEAAAWWRWGGRGRGKHRGVGQPRAGCWGVCGDDDLPHSNGDAHVPVARCVQCLFPSLRMCVGGVASNDPTGQVASCWPARMRAGRWRSRTSA